MREERLQNGDFSFDAAEDGIYRYCFSNVYPSPNIAVSLSVLWGVILWIVIIIARGID